MMRHRGIEHLLAAAAVTMIAGHAAAQAPSDKGAAAEALFQEARTLSGQKNYAAACPKFKASYDLDPGYGVLFNLAECYANLGKTASAWVAYADAAAMAKNAGQKDRIEKAEKRGAELAPKLEKLTITATDPPAGLVIKRDGVALDAATWGTALPVDPGKHTITAEAPGKKPWTGEVETKGPGSTAAISVPALESAPAPVETASPGASAAPTVAPTGGPGPDDSGRATRRLIGLIAGGVGVAALAAGGAMGGLASSKWNDAKNNHCRTDTLCDDTGVALVGDAKTFATVSTALFIGGGVLAAGGAALFVVSLGSGKKEGASLQVAPGIGSLTIKGQF